MQQGISKTLAPDARTFRSGPCFHYFPINTSHFSFGFLREPTHPGLYRIFPVFFSQKSTPVLGGLYGVSPLSCVVAQVLLLGLIFFCWSGGDSRRTAETAPGHGQRSAHGPHAAETTKHPCLPPLIFRYRINRGDCCFLYHFLQQRIPFVTDRSVND